VTGDWRRLHNEKFNDCTFQHIVFRDPKKDDQMGGTCSVNEGEELCVQYFNGDA
jgi:hypothetical protein